MAPKAAAAAFPENAACNCLSPFAVGVTSDPDDAGAWPIRCASMFVPAKNHSLSRTIGPPTVPPYRLSTYLGTTGCVQESVNGGIAVPTATPGGQNPLRGVRS